jgi:hypothetical protein
MTTCPACGFDLWKYNKSTYTCKHGHRFDLNLKPVPAQPVYVAKPQHLAAPHTRIVEHRQPLALAAGAGAIAAVAVDLLLAVIA